MTAGGIIRGLDEIHPTAHALKLLFEDSLIPVEFVHVPGEDRRHISPGTGAATLHIHRRNNHRHHPAAFCLFESTIIAEFGKERAGIHVETSRAREHLCVPSPTQALITLRAIGGDIQEVAFLAPESILEQPVYLLVGRLDIADDVHLRIDHAAGEVVSVHLTGPSGHFDIPEPIEGEIRLDDGFPTIGNIGIFGLGRTQVIPVEVTALQHLAVL